MNIKNDLFACREEAEFAKNYRESIDGLFKEVALSKMPGNQFAILIYSNQLKSKFSDWYV